MSRAMTYTEAFARLGAEFSLPDLTARNVLHVALSGQSARIGGSQSPYRVVHEPQTGRAYGYRLVDDGYVIGQTP